MSWLWRLCAHAFSILMVNTFIHSTKKYQKYLKIMHHFGGIDSDEHPWTPIILMFAKGMGLRSMATSTPYVSNTWLLDHILRWLLVQWSVIAPAIHAWMPTAMSPIGCCCKHGSRVTRIDRQIRRLNKNNPTPQCIKNRWPHGLVLDQWGRDYMESVW